MRLTKPKDFSQPQPFYCHPKRFGVIWSARSACSPAALWFFWHCGWLAEATALHWFPHRYLNQVMARNPVYRQWFRALRTGETPFVRVIRDPYKRAVSSYSFAVRKPHICQAEISRFLGREVRDRQGFSFREFLAFLASVDLSDANIHIKEQFNRIEGVVRPALTINVDKGELLAGLEEFERIVGLAVSDLHTGPLAEAMRICRKHHTTKRFDPGRDYSGERIGAGGVDGRWPDDESLLTDANKRMIENLYARDFETYRAAI